MLTPILGRQGRRVLFCLALATLSFPASPVQAATNVIFSTGFEYSEGYSTNLDLVGQKDWLGFGTGGNGIVTGFLSSTGQQAYVGFSPPTDTQDTGLYVWQPVNLDPVPSTNPIVLFSVKMAILDSANGIYDYFDWSVYNASGDFLFTLDFDNSNMAISYALDDTNDFVPTGLSFTNGGAYDITLAMDFAQNRWSAYLNGIQFLTNLPITTIGSPLSFGDADAVWYYDAMAPGDNFMVFDDYRVAAASVPPAQLEWVANAPNGPASLRLHGLPDYQFAIDASTNLVQWSALMTNAATGGSFDYTDSAAAGLDRRFYRGRWVP